MTAARVVTPPQAALKVSGVSDELRDTLLRGLAAILHLGNLEVLEDPDGNSAIDETQTSAAGASAGSASPFRQASWRVRRCLPLMLLYCERCWRSGTSPSAARASACRCHRRRLRPRCGRQ